MSSIWLLIYQPLPYGLGAEPAHPRREQGNAPKNSCSGGKTPQGGPDNIGPRPERNQSQNRKQTSDQGDLK